MLSRFGITALRLLIAAAFLLAATGGARAQSPVYAWRLKRAGAGLTVGINPLNPSTLYAEGSTGTFMLSRDAGLTWEFRTNPGLALIRQIVVHPSDTAVIFATDANSGLQKSTDEGLTWRTVLANFGIDGESIALDPVHPDTMYAGNFADGRVYRSTDRGETWTLRGTAGASLCAFTARPDSANILYGGTGGGTISKSTDGGATWRIVKPAASGRVFQEVPKIVIASRDPLTAYATINGDPHPDLGVWKTTDGGESWVQSPLPLAEVPTWGMTIDETDSTVVYAGTFTGGTITVFRSADGGAHWGMLSAGLPPQAYIWSLHAHPADPGFVVAAYTTQTFGAGGILRLASSTASISGVVKDAVTGDTVTSGYVRIPSTGDAANLSQTGGTFAFGYFEGDPSLSPAGEAVAYPYRAAFPVFAFTPGSNVVQDIALGRLPLSPVSGSLKDSLGGGVEGVFVFTTQGPLGPVAVRETTDVAGTFNAGNLYVSEPPATSDYSLSVEAAIPYRQLTISAVHLDSAGTSLDLVTSPADLFIVGEDSLNLGGSIAASAESLGLSPLLWNSITRGPAPIARGGEFTRKCVIYFSGNKHVPLDSATLASFDDAAAAGVNLFITGQDILEKNGAASFFASTLSIAFGGNTPITFCQGLDLFNGMGFYTTLYDEQTSRDIVTPLAARAVPVLRYGGIGGTAGVRVDSTGPGRDRGKAVFLGVGIEGMVSEPARIELVRRVLGYFDGSIVLGAGEELLRLPSAFRLDQNFPDPFNPSTTIRFATHERGRVTLVIYDLLGREAARPVDDILAPGEHAVRWNAASLPSGVYFCRLTSGSSTAVRRMLLLR